MAYSGRYSIKNVKKYRGDPTMVFFRSLWEYKCMKFLDSNQNVLEWSSEEIRVKYVSPVDNRIHTYFVDFYIKLRNKNNEIMTYLWEIKPYRQTQQPEMKVTPKTKKPTNSYINQCMTYAINQAKWEAATHYCHENGWKFQVITEKEAGFLS